MEVSKMPEEIAVALNTIKSFAKYLVIPTGAITFLSDDWLNYIRLLELKNSFGAWVSGIFLLSSSIVIIDVFTRLFTLYIADIINKIAIKKLEKILIALTKTERVILKKIYDNDSAELQRSNALVHKLEQLGIIIKPNLSPDPDYFSYTLQPWALTYLKEHPTYFTEVSHQ